NLTSLNLSWNPGISDLSPLASLTNLTSLNLEGNRVSDISPLKENSGLTPG
ncbi:MAG: leucine-rich repeat domain-containing protein, partial [Dehalococcoidia bacterium]|nr:leucine-rich repeat domain-containing protein [Dehalococcoidia bacterium]